MLHLDNFVTVITGASRGIGRGIALLFAEAGSDVIINYRADRDAAEKTSVECEAYGVRAVCHAADMANKAAVDTMISSVIDEFGRIDCLITNAGIWEHNPIDRTTDDRIRRTLNINLMGTYYPIMAVVPHMKARRSGAIITISSTAGQRGESEYSPYAASKSAVIGITKSLAVELAPHNIRVNCVAPGWVESDMTLPTLESDKRDWVLSAIPLGRVGQPREIAGPCLFLASDLAGFMTGEVINVNGGAVLCG